MHRGIAALAAASIAVLAGRVPQQEPAELPLAQPAILRIYDKGPDGLELFKINHVVIEPKSGALWLQCGARKEPPVRIDRKTGAMRTIGRTGAGPDEFLAVFEMVPGAYGDVGIWDPNRRLWFWVDSAGRQVRRWPIATSNYVYDGTFADMQGNVYVMQPARPLSGPSDALVVVRLDSAVGFRDTIPMPLSNDPLWIWNARNGNVRYSMPVDYSPRALWGIDTRGRMYAAWSDSSFVLVKDGERARRLLLPNYREALTSAERSTASAGLDNFALRMQKQKLNITTPRPPIPSSRPQIASILPEMNGGLAIVRSRPCANVPTWRAPGSATSAIDPKARCAFVERVDLDGRRMRPFSLLLGDRLLVVRGDTAWVVRENADGLQRVLELVIQR